MSKNAMFEKYDNGVVYTPINTTDETPSKDLANVHYLTNIHGDVTGITANAGSVFKVYFSLDYDESVEFDVGELIYTFNIYNHLHELVYESEAIYDADTNSVCVDIISDGDEILPYGNYFMRLTTEIYGITRRLFDEPDATLLIG